MSFGQFTDRQRAVQLLQRSLARGRLAHAYLFAGPDTALLEFAAQTLAQTLNCSRPIQHESARTALDCCDVCGSCQKIAKGIHPDVQWVRAESRSRVITIDQMRDLMQTVHLKPLEAEYKVAVIAAADRLNAQAANAFLKTLEEPPQKSVLILLSTDPQQILETILSRCLRLDFAGENTLGLNADQMAWLISFTDLAADEQIGILGRYRLLGILQKKLAQTKSDIESTLAARSPLERYEDADPSLRAKWEEELAAAIEAEYRRQRTDLLRVLLYWLRDVWLQTLAVAGARLLFPQLASRTQKCAQRLSTNQAMENLEVLERTQRLLESNVQEALALEVGLLKLSL